MSLWHGLVKRLSQTFYGIQCMPGCSYKKENGKRFLGKLETFEAVREGVGAGRTGERVAGGRYMFFRESSSETLCVPEG